jgi:cation transport ATPase
LSYYSQSYARRLLIFVFFMALPCYFFASMTFWLQYTLALALIFAPYDAIVKAAALFLTIELRAAAARGVVVLKPRILEEAGQAGAVALAKSSSLTSGGLIMANIYAPYPFSRPELLRFALFLTRAAGHPLADTIAREMGEKEPPDAPPVEIDLNAEDELNIMGSVDGHRVLLGSNAFLSQQGVPTYILLRKYAEFLAHGSTVLFVAVDGEAAGLLAFVDDIRPEAFAAVRAMREHKIKNLVLLSKDQEKATSSLARPLGFTECIGDLTKAGKAMAVKKVRHKYGSVLMGGHPTEDAEALSHATISVAFGHNGGETAADAVSFSGIDGLAALLAASANYWRKIGLYRKIALAVKFLFFFAVAFRVIYLWQALALQGIIGLLLILVARRV